MIAIAGGKGGCGKTTTTLCVARALVDGGVGARAVDLDIGMPNLHRLAGVEREPTLADRVDAATDRRGARDERQRDRAGVEIVPAPRVTAPVDVADALAELRHAPGVTLLDCPASAGPDAALPLREASAVLLVSADRPESLEDAAKTGRMARSLDVPVVGAVVTRADALSERARCTLPTDHVVPVPESGAPLDEPAVRDRYGVVAEWLAETRTGPTRQRRSSSGAGRSAAGEPPGRPVPSGGCAADGRRSTDGQASARAASARPADAAATPTRRRGRRSRRSRGGAGVRSSSRGGGGPSDRR